MMIKLTDEERIQALRNRLNIALSLLIDELGETEERRILEHCEDCISQERKNSG